MSNMSSYEGDFLVNDSYLQYQIARERLLLSLANNTGRLFQEQQDGLLTGHHGLQDIHIHTVTWKSFPALLALCEGNYLSPVESLREGPVRIFSIFFNDSTINCWTNSRFTCKLGHHDVHGTTLYCSSGARHVSTGYGE